MTFMHLASAPTRRPFTDWLADVDRILTKEYGLTSSACDWCWRAEHDVGSSPRVAVSAWASDWKPDRSSIWL